MMTKYSRTVAMPNHHNKHESNITQQPQTHALPRIKPLIANVSLLCFMTLCCAVDAQDLTVSIPNLGDNTTASRSNFYMQLAEGLDELYEDGHIIIRIRPFSRSVREVTQGLSDIHLPLICSDTRSYPYFDFTSETISQVTFGLYSHKENKITTQALRDARYQLKAGHIATLSPNFTKAEKQKLKRLNQSFANKKDFLSAVVSTLEHPLSPALEKELLVAAFPFNIETDRLHTDYIDTPAHASTSMTSSLKKLASQRIDGYIFAVITVENLIKSNQLDDQFNRDLYRNYNICMVIKKNSQGGLIDQKISKAMRAYKSTEQYQTLFGSLQAFDQNWLNTYINTQNTAEPN